MSDVLIPDVTEPIVAARMWKFVPSKAPKKVASTVPRYTQWQEGRPPRLASTSHECIWETREMTATHSRDSSYLNAFAFASAMEALGDAPKPRLSGVVSVADQTNPPPHEPPHEPPEPSCRCGVYAASDLSTLEQYGASSLYIFGIVHLWGRVIPAERGWRAQHARIESLISHTFFDKRTRDVAATYGVPVRHRWPVLTQPEEVIGGHR